MYSLPFQVSSLIALCRLMVKWKRAELRHRAQLARDKQDWEKANRAVRATLNGCLLLLFLLVMNYNSYCWHTTWENRFGICTIVFSVVDVLWRGDVISMKSAQFANLAFMEQTQQASSQEKPQMLLCLSWIFITMDWCIHTCINGCYKDFTCSRRNTSVYVKCLQFLQLLS